MKKVIIALIVIFVVGFILFFTTNTKKQSNDMKDAIETIDIAKKKAAESANISYIDNLEKEIMLSKLSETQYNVSAGDIYNVSGEKITKKSGAEVSSEIITIKNYNGEYPIAGEIIFMENEEVYTASLTYKDIFDGTVTYSVK